MGAGLLTPKYRELHLREDFWRIRRSMDSGQWDVFVGEVFPGRSPRIEQRELSFSGQDSNMSKSGHKNGTHGEEMHSFDFTNTHGRNYELRLVTRNCSMNTSVRKELGWIQSGWQNVEMTGRRILIIMLCHGLDVWCVDMQVRCYFTPCSEAKSEFSSFCCQLREPSLRSMFFNYAHFKVMEGSARRGQHEEALEVDWLATLQSLQIYALNSTVSFVVDTLAHHRGVLGQMQDETEALRSQLEVLQLQHPPPASSSQQSEPMAVSSTHHDVAPLPDLNVPIENLDMEDEVLVNLPSTDN